MIEDGVPLTFFKDTPPPRSYNNTTTVDRFHDQCAERLRYYEQLGAISLWKEGPPPLWIHPLHVVIKPHKKPRIVFDLSRNLNAFLESPSFSYSSTHDAVRLAKPGDWLGKIDLSDAFLSFPMASAAKEHMAFNFDGRTHRFDRMPFGLCSAPRACTMLLDVVSSAMWEAGILHTRYLDDFLFFGSTRAHTAAAMKRAAQILCDFGLALSAHKTGGPAQRLEFLGIVIDTRAQTLALTTERLNELHALINTTLEQKHTSRKALQSLLGKFSFAASVLPAARPFMRCMIDASVKAHRNPVFTLPAAFKEELNYWRTHLQAWNGKQQWRASTPSLIFASDASLEGWGFCLESASPDVFSRLPPWLTPGTAVAGTWSLA
jgi:hypothetical protein